MNDVKILELSDKNYSDFMEKTESVVFIDFYSETCPPCQTLLSYLPNLVTHFRDKYTTPISQDKFFKNLIP